jgi:alginate O-acetyltransferase complex protein AlgI
VISGPICRLPDMLPQFRSETTTRWIDIGVGFRRIATGVLLMQLAKLLGQGILAGDGINSGFDRLTRWSGADVWCLAFGFALQLFFDFAGYSHIAIGAAKAFGFTLPENFDHPFHSTTPSIFWTRWHMSLSFWIRDYVFLPLAMLRRELWWRNTVLIISMVLFGLWHKATLLFVLWGCYHGVLLVLHRQVQQLQRRLNWNIPDTLWTPVSWFTTTTLINLGWIFFRANSHLQARQMLSALLSPATYLSHALTLNLYFLVAALALGYAIILRASAALDFYAADRSASESGLISLIVRWRWFWLPPLYAVALLFVSVVTFTRGGTAAQLMYRRF